MIQSAVSKPTPRKGRKNMTLVQPITNPSSVTTEVQETKWLKTNEVLAAVNNAVSQDIEMKKKHGLPIAGYDIETQKAYLEYADGTREYV